MRKLIIVMGMLMALMTASPVMADQVQLVGGSGYGPYQRENGGEFTFQILDQSLNWILDSYVPGKTSDVMDALYLHNIQTFCVETGETIAAGGIYDVTFSNHSISTGKNLTRGAAWLYHEFQSGTLDGYDYTDSRTTAQALQETIWYLMGVGGQPSNHFWDLVKNDDPLADNNGQYPVLVMNLWDPGHVYETDYGRQDQLVCGSVPEPATLLFLGSGLLGLVALRRKVRK